MRHDVIRDVMRHDFIIGVIRDFRIGVTRVDVWYPGPMFCVGLLGPLGMAW